MDFFKRKISEGEEVTTKLVGTQIPTTLFYYFNLFCLVDKRSKSSIVRPFIEEWAEKAQEEFSEKQLIKLAASMAFNKWKAKKRKPTGWPNILKIQERELRNKNIEEPTIVKIIEKIDALKRKHDSVNKIDRIIKKRKKIKRAYDKSSKNKEQ